MQVHYRFTEINFEVFIFSNGKRIGAGTSTLLEVTLRKVAAFWVACYSIFFKI
jgi:hypothetical protein